MSKQQWGHGYHAGVDKGMEWAEAIAQGSVEVALSAVGEKLILLANALKYPDGCREQRTDLWYRSYMFMVAREIERMAAQMPVGINQCYEFQKDLPED